MKAGMFLEVKGIKVFYERSAALKGVSLKLEKGSMITLVGANGAGKTTTLRTISGLKVPTAGQIWYQDSQIDGISPNRIVAMGIAHVPEGRRLFPDMTVLENLRMGAYLRTGPDVDHDLDERVYRHFPVLKERQKQLAGSLSGGEQQMVAIGRALMARPQVLLLDEPSIGLSPLAVKEIARIIMDIQQEGVSIVLVEQNVQMAFRLAQKAYVLETGKIVLSGNTKDLAQNDEVKKAYLGG
jgi:branched-chain amino acid transport system ATP-binding protein